MGKTVLASGLGVRMVNFSCKLQRKLRIIPYDAGKFTAKSCREHQNPLPEPLFCRTEDREP